MAVSLFSTLSRRLQAPVAALLLLAGVQLVVAAAEPEPAAPRAVTQVRAALPSPLR